MINIVQTGSFNPKCGRQ